MEAVRAVEATARFLADALLQNRLARRAETSVRAHPTILTLAAATYCVVVATIVPQALPMLVSTLTGRLHLSVMQAGILSATDLGGSVVSSVLLARPFRRLSLSRITQIGLTVTIGSDFTCIATHSFSVLAALRLIAGIGEGIILITGLTVYAQARSVERVYAMSTLALTTIAAAFMIVIPTIVPVWGPGSCFGLLAVFSMPALWTARLFQRADTGAGSPSPVNLGRSAWLVIGALAIAYCGLGASWANLGQLGQAAQLNTLETGSAISLATFTSPTALLLVAIVSGRVSNRSCIAAASLLMIVALTTIEFATGRLVFTAATVLFVFGWFFYVPPIFGVTASLDPSGTVSVIANACANGGLALGPLLAVPALQRWGLGILPYVTSGLLIVALALVATAIPRIQHTGSHRRCRSRCNSDAPLPTRTT